MARLLKVWRIWAKALGEKSGATDREADYIAIVRSVIVGLNFITCLFIIAGFIPNWCGLYKMYYLNAIFTISPIYYIAVF